MAEWIRCDCNSLRCSNQVAPSGIPIEIFALMDEFGF